NRGVFEQFGVVFDHFGVFDAILFGRFLGALFDDIAERDHLHILQPGQAGHVLAVGNAAASHNSDPNLIRHACRYSFVLKRKFSLKYTLCRWEIEGKAKGRESKKEPVSVSCEADTGSIIVRWTSNEKEDMRCLYNVSGPRNVPKLRFSLSSPQQTGRKR